MVMKFTNNAATTLATGITNSATSLTVSVGAGALFPTSSGSDYFYCTLANSNGAIEIIKVTTRSTDTFTIVRGQDGTNGQAWNSGDKVELRLVAANLNDLPKLDETNTFSSNNTFTQNVGIGISSSIAAPLQVYNATSALIQVDGDAASNIRATRYSTDTNAPSLQTRKARGTYASPTAVASGDTVGSFLASAYGGTNYRPVGQVTGVVDTYTSDTNISGYLVFYTNSGSTVVTEKMRIDSSGNVLVTSAAGLGYGTGSGGTVTQGAGSGKATTVTLNKPTGIITMNNAALAAGASIAFALSNTLMAALDTVLLSHNANGGTANAYVLQCLTCGANSATIRVTNITAGSLSEAVQVNFSIIKGASA